MFDIDVIFLHVYCGNRTREDKQLKLDDYDNVGQEGPWLRFASVDVWRIDLVAGARQVDLASRTLSVDELARADRFLRPELRSRYVVAHGAVRSILSRYSGLAPMEHVFDIATLGKPFLAGGPHFNLSHSGDMALLAVCANYPVGIDIERIDPKVPIYELATRFFTPGEVDRIRAAAAGAQVNEFFTLWCAKEAYLKLIGEGIGYGLSRCEVHGIGTELTILDPSAHADAAQIRLIDVGKGYAGALCVSAGVL